jgi:hypothetical protein
MALLLVVVLVLVLGLFGDFEDEDDDEKDAVMALFSDSLSAGTMQLNWEGTNAETRRTRRGAEQGFFRCAHQPVRCQ